MKKITIADGKYTFVLNDDGVITEVLRHGCKWDAGDNIRFMGVVLSLVQHLDELHGAADQCIKDDCDAVIHPYCWDSLKRAVEGIQYHDPS